jgi:predicted deoxyguanosinetriphosphate triphosphohydrolase
MPFRVGGEYSRLFRFFPPKDIGKYLERDVKNGESLKQYDARLISLFQKTFGAYFNDETLKREASVLNVKLMKQGGKLDKDQLAEHRKTMLEAIEKTLWRNKAIFFMVHFETHGSMRERYSRESDRIINCEYFRYMQYKAQVMVNSASDDQRTRLTHSLEVANVGKNIARQLSCNCAIVEAAALGHDLGHVPFGHQGEEALDECLHKAWAGRFSHSLQSVKVLGLLAQHPSLYDKFGINGLCLSRPVLECVLKHDTDNLLHNIRQAGWCLQYDGWRETLIGEYSDDLGEWKEQEFNLGLSLGGLETQIVYWADKIAYSGHDWDEFAKSGLLDNMANRIVYLFKQMHQLRHMAHGISSIAEDRYTFPEKMGKVNSINNEIDLICFLRYHMEEIHKCIEPTQSCQSADKKCENTTKSCQLTDEERIKKALKPLIISDPESLKAHKDDFEDEFLTDLFMDDLSEAFEKELEKEWKSRIKNYFDKNLDYEAVKKILKSELRKKTKNELKEIFNNELKEKLSSISPLANFIWRFQYIYKNLINKVRDEFELSFFTQEDYKLILDFFTVTHDMILLTGIYPKQYGRSYDIIWLICRYLTDVDDRTMNRALQFKLIKNSREKIKPYADKKEQDILKYGLDLFSDNPTKNESDQFEYTDEGGNKKTVATFKSARETMTQFDYIIDKNSPKKKHVKKLKEWFKSHLQDNMIVTLDKNDVSIHNRISNFVQTYYIGSERVRAMKNKAHMIIKRLFSFYMEHEDMLPAEWQNRIHFESQRLFARVYENPNDQNSNNNNKKLVIKYLYERLEMIDSSKHAKYSNPKYEKFKDTLPIKLLLFLTNEKNKEHFAYKSVNDYGGRAMMQLLREWCDSKLSQSNQSDDSVCFFNICRHIAKARAIADYIASMTDRFAEKKYNEIISSTPAWSTSFHE